MPKLNGIELYRQALKLDPDLGRRFVFFTGTEKAEYRRFILSSEGVLLIKPAPLQRLRAMIHRVAGTPA